MQGIVCDRCGEGLLIREDVRYILKLEIHAPYDPLEITPQDLARDNEQEIADTLKQIEETSPEELENQVHFRATYDLCASCQRTILRDPLQKPQEE